MAAQPKQSDKRSSTCRKMKCNLLSLLLPRQPLRHFRLSYTLDTAWIHCNLNRVFLPFSLLSDHRPPCLSLPLSSKMTARPFQGCDEGETRSDCLSLTSKGSARADSIQKMSHKKYRENISISWVEKCLEKYLEQAKMISGCPRQQGNNSWDSVLPDK